jgi:hypothetical protein
VISIDPSIFTDASLHPGEDAGVEVLAPRQRITSVPLAVKAEELLAGRFEMDTRTRTISTPASGSSSFTYQAFGN